MPESGGTEEEGQMQEPIRNIMAQAYFLLRGLEPQLN